MHQPATQAALRRAERTLFGGAADLGTLPGALGYIVACARMVGSPTATTGEYLVVGLATTCAAKRAKMSRVSWYRIERGQVDVPLSTLGHVATALDWPLPYLVAAAVELQAIALRGGEVTRHTAWQCLAQARGLRKQKPVARPVDPDALPGETRFL